ncbi:MAG: hypothetical protein OEW52_09785 [Thermoleophilia bacterium]|nr:hypothetical protein [Thermoleophilia bacterium]MDH4339367.1 hypothetical protein [Thermoleophilia bacterium]MDH5281422.1 hypothetical protein [Thermoleophilia bacterium]
MACGTWRGSRHSERPVRNYRDARRGRLVRLAQGRLPGSFSPNTLQRFDPGTERFLGYRIPTSGTLVRQIVIVDGVIWGSESATQKLIAFNVGG